MNLSFVLRVVGVPFFHLWYYDVIRSDQSFIQVKVRQSRFYGKFFFYVNRESFFFSKLDIPVIFAYLFCLNDVLCNTLQTFMYLKKSRGLRYK